MNYLCRVPSSLAVHSDFSNPVSPMSFLPGLPPASLLARSPPQISPLSSALPAFSAVLTASSLCSRAQAVALIALYHSHCPGELMYPSDSFHLSHLHELKN